MKKIFTIILSIITGLLVVTVVYFVAMRMTNNVPQILGHSFLYIVSPSMEDTIPVKTYILVNEIDINEIKEGDIIAFFSEDPSLPNKNIPITHRVIKISDDRQVFYTKGDNNALADSYPAKSENILGKYEKSLPVISSIAGFFQNPLAFLLLIIVPALILFFLEIINIKKALTEKRGKGDDDGQ